MVELGVGLLMAASMLLLRIALNPLAGDRAPYAFVFLGVVLASVVAGWRSGLVALIAGQTLTWVFVVEQILPLSIHNARLGGLIIATVSQLITLSILAAYQSEIGKGLLERERRLELLDQARRELDHRAKNNFQTVLSLIQLQAAREKEVDVKEALAQVSDRISAISVATEQLAIRSDDLATVRLRDHLCELCAQLERGLARGEVKVECEVPDVSVSADTAIHLAIIVNELVTNALKHAFEEGRTGLVRVRSKMVGDALELEVSDNGAGMKRRSPAAGSGLGHKLVETFARHLNARLEVETSPAGTTHKILVPALA